MFSSKSLISFFFFHIICLQLFTISQLPTAVAYNILIIPQPAHSHVASLIMLGLELTDRGHQVHLLLPAQYPLRANTKSQNTSSSIIVERYGDAGNDVTSGEDGKRPTNDKEERLEEVIQTMLETNSDMFLMIKLLWENVLADRQQLLGDNEKLIAHLERIKFDIAIIDSNLMAKHTYLIPLRLRVPWITYTDYPEPWLIRLPWLPSFVPSHIAGAYSDHMSFVQRFRNTVTEVLINLYNPLPPTPEHLLNKYRQYGEFSSMDDLISRSELFITTSDPVLDYAKPTMPNVIQAGGLTIVPSNGSELPADIKSFISEAKLGVVLVTFGSLAARLPEDTVRKFAAAFERLGDDYRVIWRLNNKGSIELSSYVMTSRWVPQNDLLGSGEVKLFITHGGNNGQFEAVYHGVPMIGFPIFGDQRYNVQRMERKGFGLAANFQDFTANELFEKMNKILTDERYGERVRKASEIYRSAPETPLSRAARAVELVTKYGGDHLRSAGNELWLFQYLMLDIVMFFVVILTLLIAAVCKVSFMIKRGLSGAWIIAGNSYQRATSSQTRKT